MSEELDAILEDINRPKVITFEVQQKILSTSPQNRAAWQAAATHIELVNMPDRIGAPWAAIRADPATFADVLVPFEFTLNNAVVRSLGMYYILAHYTFGYYLLLSSYKDTYSGPVIKSTGQSTPLPHGTLASLRKMYDQKAGIEVDKFRAFIDFAGDARFAAKAVQTRGPFPRLKGLRSRN